MTKDRAKVYASLMGKEKDSKQEEYGTKLVGLVQGQAGPFRCDTCLHMTGETSCSHPKVMRDPEVNKNEDGTAYVEKGPYWCCTYWWPGKGQQREKETG